MPVNLAPLAAFNSLAPRRQVLLAGRGATGLALYVTARRACESLPVRVVCGDNRFDPYFIARFAKSQGSRPADALRSILIARAFTAYQLVELIQRLEAFANDVLMVTGICSAFFDDDLTDTDAARLFYRAFWKLQELAERGASVLLVECGSPVMQRRGYFLQDVMHTSAVVLALDQATCTLEEKFGRAKFRLNRFNRLIGA